MEMIVGYSGFVGSNICKLHKFDGLYDAKNVEESYGKNPDLLVYAGVPAQKFLANKEPEQDFQIIENAIYNIQRIKPKEIVLISTIDIYKKPYDVDEDSDIETDGLQPYGYNRYYLEKWVRENIENHLVIHLPGLYGENIKKNFIYDFIHIIPSMLTGEKYKELLNKNDFLKNYYDKQDNGFYKVRKLSIIEEKKLKEYFERIGFSALNFTDSRGTFQFYPLRLLWRHIEIARENKLKVLNLATEPVTISEIYEYIKSEKFINEISQSIPYYNFKTKYAELYKGKNNYVLDKKFILKDINEFVINEQRRSV